MVVHFGAFMSRIKQVSPPSVGMLGIEPIRAALEYACFRLAPTADYERGDGHAVVLFPGLGSDEDFMGPLMQTCKRLGYACFHWGRGRNVGPAGKLVDWLDDLRREIDVMTDAHEAVTLLGWSLGGLYARELARAIPARVRQVITLGTPSTNIGDSSHAGWLYGMLGNRPVTIDRRIAKTLARPLPVPTTSIYSRSDGVVAWEACRIIPGALSENIEIESSHLGLVWHPETMRIIANRLAQPEGEWTPWKGTLQSGRRPMPAWCPRILRHSELPHP